MTCIVAVTDGRTVVLGGDSAATGGQELRVQADPKVFLVENHYAIGFTTSFRMGQILCYEANLPQPPTIALPIELHRFMVAEFIPAVRRAFLEHGFSKKARWTSPHEATIMEEGQELGGLFLVGVAGQVFEIRQDYHVARPAAAYSAVGFGASVALGALHAMESHQSLTLKQRAFRALRASEAYCPSVRSPFNFVELSQQTRRQSMPEDLDPERG